MNRLTTQPHGMRRRVTVLATGVVAVPVLAIAVLAAIFLRAQAMRPDAAPHQDASICAGTSSTDLGPHIILPGEEAPPTGVFHRYCARNADSVETPLSHLGDLVPHESPDPNETVLAFASYSSSISVPQLSLWPFTDPYSIKRIEIVAPAQTFGPLPLPEVDAQWPERAAQREQLAQVQRTLNHRVLALAGGALLLIGLFGYVVWLAMGRVLRPVEAIRREMADITEQDLSRRVPVPRGRSEITALATTVNTTLDRLETAVEDNRRFVADASHELRSPITALRAELEIATAHPGQADWPAVVDAALADTDRLQHLATDLLLLARLDHTPTTGHNSTVDLTTLVAEHTAHRRTRHTLVTDLPDHPAPVHGRRALLERLLGNLLDNAERHATTTITIHLTTADQQAILEVLDDGPGIPPDDRERVFDRFTRLDDARTRDTGGTGLGLPIARRIATTHHGTLHATDHPGTAGARLVATLPLGPGGDPRDRDAGRPAFDG
ncbi:HAMP domain-containing sensor histidine kinase [Actinosynnema sp. NPDC050436]|uniref:sensor histidine kinase n=1 Tax=Actinosynnema sp. NPDC050436 TaxID=3155659 RepID=UPI0033EFF1AC